MFALTRVVPWGRSFDENRRMFALSERDLGLKILGCADGPAGFNAEATRRGARVISCDPLYQFSTAQIRDRVHAAFPDVMEQTRRNQARFVWNEIPSLDALGRRRMEAMRVFLDDFEQGKRAGRYVPAALPLLPFPDGAFDLALCSHFLFLYSEQLTESFHRHAIKEMCRVAREVRVFPLVALDGRRSRFVDPVVAERKAARLVVSIETVSYEFQRGANELLRIRAGCGGGLLEPIH